MVLTETENRQRGDDTGEGEALANGSVAATSQAADGRGASAVAETSQAGDSGGDTSRPGSVAETSQAGDSGSVDMREGVVGEWGVMNARMSTWVTCLVVTMRWPRKAAPTANNMARSAGSGRREGNGGCSSCSVERSRTTAATRGRSERSGREERKAALERSSGSGAPNQPDRPRLPWTGYVPSRDDAAATEGGGKSKQGRKRGKRPGHGERQRQQQQQRAGSSAERRRRRGEGGSGQGGWGGPQRSNELTAGHNNPTNPAARAPSPGSRRAAPPQNNLGRESDNRLGTESEKRLDGAFGM